MTSSEQIGLAKRYLTHPRSFFTVRQGTLQHPSDRLAHDRTVGEADRFRRETDSEKDLESFTESETGLESSDSARVGRGKTSERDTALLLSLRNTLVWTAIPSGPCLSARAEPCTRVPRLRLLPQSDLYRQPVGLWRPNCYIGAPPAWLQKANLSIA